MLVADAVGHAEPPPDPGMSVTDSSRLSLSLGMPAPKENCLARSYSTFLEPSHIRWLFCVAQQQPDPFVSRENNCWGLRVHCGASWGLADTASPCNSSFPWFYLPHPHWALILRAFWDKSPAWKSPIHSLLLGEHDGRQKPSLTPHKSRWDIRSRQRSAVYVTKTLTQVCLKIRIFIISKENPKVIRASCELIHQLGDILWDPDASPPWLQGRMDTWKVLGFCS